jgi:uncharacterized DUF497 family protein
MRFTWSETKRKSNIEKHGFDLADAPQVFAGPTFTYEDDRLDYSEQRFVTLGLLIRWFGGFNRPHRKSTFDSRHLTSQGNET